MNQPKESGSVYPSPAAPVVPIKTNSASVAHSYAAGFDDLHRGGNALQPLAVGAVPPAVNEALGGGMPQAAARAAAQWHRLPTALKARAQWLLASPDAKGDLKVPTSIRPDGTQYAGSSTDRSTWLPFEVATSWAAHYGLGAGFCLAPDDPFACIDCDVKGAHNEPDPSKWTPQHLVDGFPQLAEQADSYSE